MSFSLEQIQSALVPLALPQTLRRLHPSPQEELIIFFLLRPSLHFCSKTVDFREMLVLLRLLIPLLELSQKEEEAAWGKLTGLQWDPGT